MLGHAARAAFVSKPRAFFNAPEVSGRKIVCGFTFIKRIGKHSATDLWFPKTLQEDVIERIAAGDTAVLDEFKVEWAAIRQFELLQESGNLAIEDLKADDHNKSFTYLVGMRAGGYRVTIVTLGRYEKPDDKDDLKILDRRIQDEITRLVQMLYMEKESHIASEIQHSALQTGNWNFADSLPHVAETLGARNLFNRSPEGREHKLNDAFFRILELLSNRNISHDVAVGLAIPELNNVKHWVYIAKKEDQFLQFQTAMNNIFQGFDHISLSGMPESKTMASMKHLRGYGERTTLRDLEANRAAAHMVWEPHNTAKPH